MQIWTHHKAEPIWKKQFSHQQRVGWLQELREDTTVIEEIKSSRLKEQTTLKIQVRRVEALGQSPLPEDQAGRSSDRPTEEIRYGFFVVISSDVFLSFGEDDTCIDYSL